MKLIKPPIGIKLSILQVETSNEQEKISLEHLLAVIAILVVSYAVGSLAFIIEKINRGNKRVKKIFV